MAERKLEDNLIKRLTTKGPHDIENEKALLCLCLKYSDILDGVVSKKLVKEDFFDPKHAYIFDAIHKAYMREGVNVDPYTIVSQLQSEDKLNQAGGTSYVLGLTNVYAVKSNVDEYVNIIRGNSKARKIVKILDDASQTANKGAGSAVDIADGVIGKLSDLRDDNDGQGFEALQTIFKQTLADIYELQHGNGQRNIVKTGFKRLDRMLGGLRPGTLNILAARPGMGKTALAINIAVNAAEFYKTNVNIFSLEMSKSEIAARILAQKTSVTARDIQTASITPEAQVELGKLCLQFGTMPIYINDSAAMNPAAMMSECKTLKSQGRLGLVIVDYLQLMSIPNKSASMSRQVEVSEISRGLKVMAKELEVPIIALSQLSRGTEGREEHTPMLSDLRDSGAIEQDADSVWFIERDSYYNKDGDAPDKQGGRIIVAKNRHGSTGNIYVKWIGSKTLFTESSKDDPEEPGNGYNATVNYDAAAANYNFEEPQAEPTVVTGGYEPSDVPPPPPPPPAEYEEMPPVAAEEPLPPPEGQIENPSNDEMFSDAEVSTDFPEDLF